MLNNFKALRDPEKTRQDYVNQMTKDCAAYYGYTLNLVEYFLSQFSPAEALELFQARPSPAPRCGPLTPRWQANEKPRPITVRVNTLKARRKDVAQVCHRPGLENPHPVAVAGTHRAGGECEPHRQVE